MRTTVLLFIIFISFASNAQDVVFTAKTEKVVALGEQFKLTYEVNAKPSGFAAPDLSNFSYSGPSSSSSSSMQIINGKVSQSVKYSYVYYLQAQKVGKFTINPATVKVGGKHYKSNSVTIEVVKGNKPGNSGADKNKDPNTISKNDLYVRMLLSKKNVYVGEQILARVKIFTREPLTDFYEQPKFPSFSGFLVQTIEGPDQIRLQRENISGNIYDTGVLYEVLLFPQRTGEIVIDEAKIPCVLRRRVRPRSFFDSGVRDYRVDIKSPKVKVNVKPLPIAGKPENFSGAVGNFNYSATIDKSKVKTNEAITLTVKITGNGNVKLIEAPEIVFPTDFDTYKPDVNVNVKNTAQGSVGTKTFKYLIIPRRAGSFRVPQISFSYFDVKAGKYKTLNSKEFNIDVSKDESETGNVQQFYRPDKADVQTIDYDIRFIETNETKLKPIDTFFSGSPTFYLTYLIALVLFIIFTIVRFKRIKENANLALVKNRKASKVSRKRLKEANTFLKANDKGKFYNSILTALWGYLSDKLAISVSELTKENVSEHLTSRNIDKELTDSLIGFLDKCEFARYAPSAEAGQMDAVYKEASKLIGKLEQKIR